MKYLTTQLIHISKKLNEYKDSNVHYSVTVNLRLLIPSFTEFQIHKIVCFIKSSSL